MEVLVVPLGMGLFRVIWGVPLTPLTVVVVVVIPLVVVLVEDVTAVTLLLAGTSE